VLHIDFELFNLFPFPGYKFKPKKKNEKPGQPVPAKLKTRISKPKQVTRAATAPTKRAIRASPSLQFAPLHPDNSGSTPAQSSIASPGSQVPGLSVSGSPQQVRAQLNAIWNAKDDRQQQDTHQVMNLLRRQLTLGGRTTWTRHTFHLQ